MLLASKHPTIERAAPTTTTTELSSQNVNNVEVDKHCYSFVKDSCFLKVSLNFIPRSSTP